MRAPAQLGGLETLGDKAFHRPCIDEHTARAGLAARLRVTLGDMHPLDAQSLHQPCPALAGRRGLGLATRVARQRQQRLLDEPADHAGIGAATADRRGSAGVGGLFIAHRLPQGIVGAGGIVARVKVISGPRFDDGVDIQHTQLAAELHDVQRRGVHRQVHAEPAIAEQPAQHLAVIPGRQGRVDERDLVLVQEIVLRRIRFDDDQPVRIVFEMPLDQRPCALADGPEADDDHRAVNAAINLVLLGHAPPFPR